MQEMEPHLSPQSSLPSPLELAVSHNERSNPGTF